MHARELIAVSEPRRISCLETIMAVKINFFGQLKEITGLTELVLDGVTDTDQLSDVLAKRFPGMTGMPYLIAIDKQLIHSNKPVKEGQEVALLPPYSGG